MPISDHLFITVSTNAKTSFLSDFFGSRTQREIGDSARRARLNTLIAMNAQILVNNRKRTLELDGRTGAYADALAAADTTNMTVFPSLSARPLVTTAYFYGRSCRYQSNEAFGTDLDALAATGALHAINMNDAIFQMHRTEGTRCHAVAESQTAISTRTKSTQKAMGRVAGLSSKVFEARLGLIACALAMNDCDFRFRCFDFRTQNRSDFGRASRAADRTQSGVSTGL